MKHKDGEAEWPEALDVRLKDLKERYGPREGESHFTPLARADESLYPDLLALAREGLEWTERVHPRRVMDGHGFWYNLFLTADRAAVRVRDDSAQAYVSKATLRELLSVLIEMSGYTVADGGDLLKRHHEALADTLLTFDDKDTLPFARMRARRLGPAAVRVMKWVLESVESAKKERRKSGPSAVASNATRADSPATTETPLLPDDPPRRRGAVLNQDRLLGQLPEVRWTEVLELTQLGDGVQFLHPCVLDTPVAFIDGYNWLHKPGTPVNISILKPDRSFPIKIDMNAGNEGGATSSRRSSSSSKTKTLDAFRRPNEWQSIVAEVHAAVYLFLALDPRPGDGKVGPLRVSVVYNA